MKEPTTEAEVIADVLTDALDGYGDAQQWADVIVRRLSEARATAIPGLDDALKVHAESPEHHYSLDACRAALPATATPGLDSPEFRAAVQAVFDAPGEWGPAQGYYSGHIDAFIDALRAALSDTPPSGETEP